MADAALTIVKILHVLGAAMWVGAGLLFLLVIAPSLRKRPIRERLERFVELTKSAGVYFPVVALVTIVTGFILAHQVSGTANPLAWDDGGYPGGRTLQVAFGFVLVAFGVGGMNGPAQKKLRTLAESPWTPASEAAAATLFRQLDLVNVLDTTVLVIITVMMVVANLGGL